MLSALQVRHALHAARLRARGMGNMHTQVQQLARDARYMTVRRQRSSTPEATSKSCSRLRPTRMDDGHVRMCQPRGSPLACSDGSKVWYAIGPPTRAMKKA